MSDERLHRAADIARMVQDRTGHRVRPVDVGRLARRGRVPIAARGKGRVLLFTERAVESVICARQRERDGD